MTRFFLSCLSTSTLTPHGKIYSYIRFAPFSGISFKIYDIRLEPIIKWNVYNEQIKHGTCSNRSNNTWYTHKLWNQFLTLSGIQLDVFQMKMQEFTVFHLDRGFRRIRRWTQNYSKNGKMFSNLKLKLNFFFNKSFYIFEYILLFSDGIAIIYTWILEALNRLCFVLYSKIYIKRNIQKCS